MVAHTFRRSGGMADASDSKSDGSDTVWVRVPPSAPTKKTILYVWSFFVCLGGRERQVKSLDLNCE